MQNKKATLSIGLLLISCVLFAQYKVTFTITQLPAYHKATDKIYLAGSINNWNPKDERLLLKTDTNKNTITLELPAGRIEYKFTKGSWDEVESANNGFPTENRTLTVESDTTIPVEIQHWADHFPKEPIKSTATKNVHLLDSAFYIPQLNRYRRIRIYLPESYSSSRKKYPVLYLQDGQNVFDNATAGFGEWGVDEALDTLGAKIKEVIVVAVDHGGSKRLNEYAPYDMEKYGKGEGDAYADFLVKTLRPYINKHYRTKKCGKHNYIAGSSMGGLISLYAILKYPKKFGGAGVFSPAFWINPQLKNIDPQKAKKIKGKIYFFAGQLEGETMVPDMLNAFEHIHEHSKAKMKTVIRAEGKHNEATWRAEFPLFYEWLLQR
jgi:predicted alpha/beta superfamily hydrolase